MAAWGILFHYVIAFCWAAFFVALYPRISWLSTSKIVSGLSFGVFIWLVMNQIVVPLSRTPELQLNFEQAVIGIFILMFCVGLPITWVAGKYYLKK
jgi:hypothetical protein